MTHLHYFPVSAGVATLFFAILLGLLFFIQIRLLGHAYSALGLDPRVATLVLFGSLLGSYINLPLLRLPEQRFVSREVVEIFGNPFRVAGRRRLAGHNLGDQRRRGSYSDPALVLSPHAL